MNFTLDTLGQTCTGRAIAALPAVPFSFSRARSRGVLRRKQRLIAIGDLSVYSFAFPGCPKPRKVGALVYRPRQFSPDMPVVVVMHGVSRNAWAYLRSWMQLADSNGFVLIIPEFKRSSWRSSREYNRGNVRDSDGVDVPATEWSFTAVETIFDAVCFHYGLGAREYRIFGHSAGAQFVHRLILHTGGARIIAAAAANAGWYMMPDNTIRFPYGLKNTGINAELLRCALQTQLTVLLGDLDDETDSPNLRISRKAMAQGPHRLARGTAFVASAQAAAGRICAATEWRIELVRGVGHSNRAIAPHACAALFSRPQ